MKKKILLVLMLGFLFFGLKDNVKAKIVLEEEIPNGTYVIGSYMFQRFAPTDKDAYQGVLRTSDIMLASHKSSDEDLTSYTIYYKNLFGEWKNGLTNESVTVPKYFEIKSIDLREVTNTPRLECSVEETESGDKIACISTFTESNGALNYSDTASKSSETTLPLPSSDFYIIKDADGKIATDQNVRYENGHFYGDNDRELSAVVDENAEFIKSTHRLTTIGNEVGEIFYIVSKSSSGGTFYPYQEDGAYADTGSFSNIVKISADSKDIVRTKPFSLTVNVNGGDNLLLGHKDVMDVKFNVYNEGYGVGCGKYEGVGSKRNFANDTHIKSFEIYSNKMAKDIVSSDGSEYVTSLSSLRYTQVHRFANIDFDAYLVAESGKLVAKEENDSTYQERGILEKLGIIDNLEFFARILICNKAEDECSYYMTETMNLEEALIKAKYGDITMDGIVDENDLEEYSLAFEGSKGEYGIKNGQIWMNADLNNDGFVNYIDEIILKQYLDGKYTETLPNKHITDYAIYGDVNEDGGITSGDLIMLKKYLSTEFNQSLTEQGYKNADVNNDGKVDYVDFALLTYYLSDVTELKDTFPIKAITEYTLYGDVNNNGLIDGDDLAYLKKYLDNKIELDAQSLKNADANGDGTIDQTDYDLINKALVNYIGSDTTNPNIASLTPLKESAVVYGDVNEDGKLTYSDVLRLMKYLSATYNTQLTEQGYKNADINNDSKVDYVDAVLLANYIADSEESVAPITAPIDEYTLYGDVNNNGLIDGDDLVYLRNYLDNKIELNAQSLKNADANGDGTIDQTDYDLINQAIYKYITSNSENPNFATLTPLK